MSFIIRAAAAVAALLILAGASFADDWTADKLRGRVLQLVDGQWAPLLRGDVVPDDRVIRTLTFSHVEFTRGDETIALGPDTQIQIHDRAGARPFTTVKQYFGSVSVDAQVENVQHFAVDTPFLAAVVKGTHFTVRSDKSGATVDVQRGHVEVDNKGDDTHVTITVGQSAKVDTKETEGTLEVSGSGELPVVVGKDGKPANTESNSGKGKSSESHGSSGKSGNSGKSGSSGEGDDSEDDNSGSNSGSGGGGDSGGDDGGDD